jgi:hypothetical protein
MAAAQRREGLGLHRLWRQLRKVKKSFFAKPFDGDRTFAGDANRK